jgi:hypothetical protein
VVVPWGEAKKSDLDQAAGASAVTLLTNTPLYCLGQLNGATELQQLCEDKLSGSILLAIANLPRYKNTHKTRSSQNGAHQNVAPQSLARVAFYFLCKIHIITIVSQQQLYPSSIDQMQSWESNYDSRENHICQFSSWEHVFFWNSVESSLHMKCSQSF